VSRGARIAAAVMIAVTFAGLETLIVLYRGLRPASVTGVEVGAVLGLLSLVLEINLIERALRTPKGDPAGATFQTFAMRLALLAPLTFAFSGRHSGVDSQAFAVSYLVTFFVYLCWLTWKTYHAPVQFRGKAAKFAPRVVEKKRDDENTLLGVRTGEWL
jgi:hypothetical protein